jgi:hypothetical protein
MNPWWNLPFAVLVVLAIWCRIGASARWVDPVVSVLAFFGVGGHPGRRGATDFFAVGGVSGLLFVAWSDKLAVVPDTWLAADALASALGLGLVGAWVLDRLGREQAALPGAASREMTMIEVETPEGGGDPGESSAPDST